MWHQRWHQLRANSNGLTYMCVCVCVCVCLCACVFVYVCTNTYIWHQLRANLNGLPRTAQARIRSATSLAANTTIVACVRVRMHVCVHLYTYFHTHTQKRHLVGRNCHYCRLCVCGVCVGVHACINIYITCIHITYIYTHTQTNTLNQR